MPDSRVSAEDVERAARALWIAVSGSQEHFPWEREAESTKEYWRDKARAVLSSIDAVPKADLEHQLLKTIEEGHARDAAEARRESYRETLERIAEGHKLGVPYAAESARKIARAALAVPQEGT